MNCYLVIGDITVFISRIFTLFAYFGLPVIAYYIGKQQKTLSFGKKVALSFFKSLLLNFLLLLLFVLLLLIIWSVDKFICHSGFMEEGYGVGFVGILGLLTIGISTIVTCLVMTAVSLYSNKKTPPQK